MSTHEIEHCYLLWNHIYELRSSRQTEVESRNFSQAFLILSQIGTQNLRREASFVGITNSGRWSLDADSDHRPITRSESSQFGNRNIRRTLRIEKFGLEQLTIVACTVPLDLNNKSKSMINSKRSNRISSHFICKFRNIYHTISF